MWYTCKVKFKKTNPQPPAKEQCTHDDASMAAVVAMLDNKWTLMLLYALSSAAVPRRFSELQQQLGGINPRTLSARLDELARLCMVKRECFAEVPPRVEYSLTTKGREFIPILNDMMAWGRKHTRDIQPSAKASASK